MKLRWLHLFLLSNLSVVSACGPSMSTPNIKHNPHPKMRYEITLTIKDAPGLFDSIRGYITYGVANPACAPFEKLSGIYRTPREQDVPFTLNRTNDAEYKGEVYLDLLQDEDYYDLGVCHWKANSVSAVLAREGVTFTTSMMSQELLAQEPTTDYFWKQAYLQPVAGNHEAGLQPTDEFKCKYPERYFTATLTAKERFE